MFGLLRPYSPTVYVKIAFEGDLPPQEQFLSAPVSVCYYTGVELEKSYLLLRDLAWGRKKPYPSLDEYCKQFIPMLYVTSVHNPNYQQEIINRLLKKGYLRLLEDDSVPYLRFTATKKFYTSKKLRPDKGYKLFIYGHRRSIQLKRI